MKIVFITFHSWMSKRQGGFHKFAESTCNRGHDVIFFSYTRPILAVLGRHELFKFKAIFPLIWGKKFVTDKKGVIKNVCLPSFSLPRRFEKKLHPKLLNICDCFFIYPFRLFSLIFLRGADCFVFESTQAVLLQNMIKRLFPKAIIIYRPSDPLIAGNEYKRLHAEEINLMKMADLSLIVNQQGLMLYQKNVENFDMKIRSSILSNGVDFLDYRKKYPSPIPMRKPCVVYVGARPIEWDLILYTSMRVKDVNFYVICPESPPRNWRELLREIPNALYIDGVSPEDVPAWITNADIVMVPNPKGWYEKWPWGLTAKYYQAMAAGKKIIAFSDSDELKHLGIVVTHSYDDFTQEIINGIKNSEVNYSINFDALEWENLGNAFVDIIEKKVL